MPNTLQGAPRFLDVLTALGPLAALTLTYAQYTLRNIIKYNERLHLVHSVLHYITSVIKTKQKL